MSFTSLDLALTGLKAAQRQLDVTSQNISNASTPGYTRKILPQQSVVAGNGQLLGVSTMNIMRSVDMSLVKELVNAGSKVENLSVRSSYLSQIQAFHGSSDAGRSISASLGNLHEAFSNLASTPNESGRLNAVVNSAQDFASKIRDFAKLIDNQRNKTQEDISYAATQLNQNLKIIAKMNSQIQSLATANQSYAHELDARDNALREVSKYLDVRTFIKDGNQLVVMTNRGFTLADERAREVTFDPDVLTAGMYYPGGGASGLLIDGDPAKDLAGENINREIGGQLGALLTLRDSTLPQYQAQLDELAQKTAARFDAAGLRLFTDHNGNVPASVADPLPITYSGFSQSFQVNPAILADYTLIRSGTTGNAAMDGSSDAVARVLDFAFGANRMTVATGTADLSAGTIFAAAGLSQTAQMIGTINLNGLTPSLDVDTDIAAAVPSSFTLDINGTPAAINLTAGMTANDLVNQINTAFGANTARLNTLGQLVINGNGNISITDVDTGTAALSALGLSATTVTATNPAFTVQVGQNAAVTITINPADTQAQLLANLNAIPGLSASLGPGGVLQLTPTDGGSIKLSDGTGQPLAGMGVTVSNSAHDPFRRTGMGPAGDISSGLLNVGTLEEFARQMIGLQSENHSTASSAYEKENVYYTMLEERNQNLFGVDMDQELSQLIRIQTAYSASARSISVIERMFDALLNAIN